MSRTFWLLSIFVLAIAFGARALSQGHLAESSASSTQPNFLILLSDDMGVDTMGIYGLSKDAASTPNLDKLARQGIMFENAWATPKCATTRAALLTGQYGVNNGVTSVPGTLPAGSLILHKAVTQLGYSNAAFGKWHLQGRRGTTTNPNGFGITHYEGNFSNVKDYYDWAKITNGRESQDSTYHTSAISGAAANWIKAQDKPWLAWVAYSAPHGPIHAPPSELHSRKLSGSPNSDARNHYLAAIEAMDTEIGRLIAEIPTQQRDNTVIIFIGDNGTPRRLLDRDVYRRSHGKSSLYEGGVRVPFIISGGVPAKDDDGGIMINIVDLFPTILDMAQPITSTIITPHSSAIDGQSFAKFLEGQSEPIRAYNYAEYEDGWAVRDANFKFIYQDDGDEELYDLSSNGIERTNIITQSQYLAKATELKQYGMSIRGER